MDLSWRTDLIDSASHTLSEFVGCTHVLQLPKQRRDASQTRRVPLLFTFLEQQPEHVGVALGRRFLDDWVAKTTKWQFLFLFITNYDRWKNWTVHGGLRGRYEKANPADNQDARKRDGRFSTQSWTMEVTMVDYYFSVRFAWTWNPDYSFSQAVQILDGVQSIQMTAVIKDILKDFLESIHISSLWGYS